MFGLSFYLSPEACTRMARADYFGNGTSHTKDGTVIDVYDRLKIQQSETNSGLAFEAAWGTDGALLLNHTRYQDTFERLQRECPSKLQQIYSPDKSSSHVEALSIRDALIFNNSQNLNTK